MTDITAYKKDETDALFAALPVVGDGDDDLVTNSAANATYALVYDADNRAVVRDGDAQTNEERFCQTQLTNGDIAATESYAVFRAPWPCVIVQAGLVQMDGPTTITADADDYWNVVLTRWRSNTAATIANKATNTATGNGAWPRRTDWNFDQRAFNADNSTLATGDIVGFAFTATGSPGTPTKVFGWIRYERLPQ